MQWTDSDSHAFSRKSPRIPFPVAKDDQAENGREKKFGHAKDVDMEQSGDWWKSMLEALSK